MSYLTSSSGSTEAKETRYPLQTAPIADEGTLIGRTLSRMHSPSPTNHSYPSIRGRIPLEMRAIGRAEKAKNPPAIEAENPPIKGFCELPPEDVFVEMAKSLKTRDIIALKRTAKPIHPLMNLERIWREIFQNFRPKIPMHGPSFQGTINHFLGNVHLGCFISRKHGPVRSRLISACGGKLFFDKHHSLLTQDVASGERGVAMSGTAKMIFLQDGTLLAIDYQRNGDAKTLVTIQTIDVATNKLLESHTFEAETQLLTGHYIEAFKELLIFTSKDGVVCVFNRINHSLNIFRNECCIQPEDMFCFEGHYCLIYFWEGQTEIHVFDLESGKYLRKYNVDHLIHDMKVLGDCCITLGKGCSILDPTIINIFDLKTGQVRQRLYLKKEYPKSFLIVDESLFINFGSSVQVLDLKSMKKSDIFPPRNFVVREPMPHSNPPYKDTVEPIGVRSFSFSNGSLFVQYDDWQVIEYNFMADHKQILKEIAEVLEQELSHTADGDFEYFSEEISAKSHDKAENERIKEQQKEAMDRFSRLPKATRDLIPLPSAIVSIAASFSPKAVAKAIRMFLKE